MHASIAHFRGDPNGLEASYDALLAEVPSANMRLHLCLRAPDGLVVVDTCPSQEAFNAFHQSAAMRTMRARHGLPEPDRVEDYPVHIAFAEGVALAVG